MPPQQPQQHVGGGFLPRRPRTGQCPVADGLDPTRVMCCRKVVTNRKVPKAPLDANSPMIPLLEEWRHSVAGLTADRVHDPSQRVPWEDFAIVVGVIGSSSRGSKRVQGGSFYATTTGDEYNRSELVQLPICCLPIVIHNIQLYDCQDECLVRSTGSLELRCQRHLDTNFTVYQLRHVPARPDPSARYKRDVENLIGVQLHENSRHLPEFRHANSRKMVDIERAWLLAEMRMGSVKETFANDPDPEVGNDQIDEIMEDIVEEGPDEDMEGIMEDADPTVAGPNDREGQRATNSPPKRVPTARSRRPLMRRGLGTVNTRSMATGHPNSQSAEDANSEEERGEEPEGMLLCSRMRRMMPDDQFDINPKTLEPYRSCRDCRANVLRSTRRDHAPS